MLTQTMPAVVRALQKSMDPQTLKAFTQALGNCNQPLTHRGSVNTAPAYVDSRSYEYPSTSYGGTWNTTNYIGGDNFFGDTYNNYEGDTNFVDLGDINNIFNDRRSYHNIFNESIAGDTFIDVAGDTINNVNNNINNSNFSFPTNNFFNQNIDNRVTNVNNQTTYNNNNITNRSVTNNHIVNNISVKNINGKPVAGPAGPPGTPGRDGRDGAPGAPGAVVPVPIQIPDFGPPQAPPAPPFGVLPITFLSGANPQVKVDIPKYKIDASKSSFDPATCTLDLQIELLEDGSTTVPGKIEGLVSQTRRVLFPVPGQ